MWIIEYYRVVWWNALPTSSIMLGTGIIPLPIKSVLYMLPSCYLLSSHLSYHISFPIAVFVLFHGSPKGKSSDAGNLDVPERSFDNFCKLGRWKFSSEERKIVYAAEIAQVWSDIDFQGLAPWCGGLSICWQRRHPFWVPVWVLATPLLI